MRDAKAERIFADYAVTFVARRVAASSGDICTALRISRRAIQMREVPVVKSADINRAQFDLTRIRAWPLFLIYRTLRDW